VGRRGQTAHTGISDLENTDHRHQRSKMCSENWTRCDPRVPQYTHKKHRTKEKRSNGGIVLTLSGRDVRRREGGRTAPDKLQNDRGRYKRRRRWVHRVGRHTVNGRAHTEASRRGSAVRGGFGVKCVSPHSPVVRGVQNAPVPRGKGFNCCEGLGRSSRSSGGI